MTTGGFDDRPATKGDLAGVKEELSGDIQRVETKVDGLETKVESLRQTVEKGFKKVSELILEGPPGLTKRVERMDKYYSIKDLMTAFHASDATVRRLLKSGKLRSVHFGGVYRVSEKDLQEYLERK